MKEHLENLRTELNEVSALVSPSHVTTPLKEIRERLRTAISHLVIIEHEVNCSKVDEYMRSKKQWSLVDVGSNFGYDEWEKRWVQYLPDKVYVIQADDGEPIYSLETEVEVLRWDLVDDKIVPTPHKAYFPTVEDAVSFLA